MRRVRPRHIAVASIAWALFWTTRAIAAEPAGFDELATQHAGQIRPLLARYCLECHSTEAKEGELDLERFATLSDVRRAPRVWQQAAEKLDQGEMPPEDAAQPTAQERKLLREWIDRYLAAEARTSAGDPGRVVLRRLSNVEYNLTVRDLTGVDLRPAKEFPLDGAAGEGFTNAGEALVMSPALLQKYLDAAKGIADHAVLVPDGVRFSSSTSRRDWTDELLTHIRALYGKYADDEGRIPLDRYLAALVECREPLAAGTTSPERIAADRGLSAKYLRTLWQAVADPAATALMAPLAARLRDARPGDVAAIAEMVQKRQPSMWRYNNVGHFKKWQEPVDPVIESQKLRTKIEPAPEAEEVVLYLVARDVGGGDGNVVLWREPRLEGKGMPALLLRDVRQGVPVARELRRKTLAGTARYLAAAEEARTNRSKPDAAALAARHALDADMLAAWLGALGIAGGSPAAIDSYLSDRIDSSGGYDFVKGWGVPATPSVVANSSDQEVRIPGIMKPHSVAVHPSPTHSIVVGFQSPVAGKMRIEPRVAHAHPECGNGVAWSVELRQGGLQQTLASGVIDRAAVAKIAPIDEVVVQAGGLVSLAIGPRDGDHSCDLTAVDLAIAEIGGEGRAWELSRDVTGDIQAGNPHPDRSGNKNVWHFYQEPIGTKETGAPAIPVGSLLDRWLAAVEREERTKLADELQHLLAAGPTTATQEADVALYRRFSSLAGPLFAGVDYGKLIAGGASAGPSPEAPPPPQNSAFGLDPSQFGRHPREGAVDGASLVVRAPSVVAVRLPADLAAGRELAVEGTLDPTSGREGAVQLEVRTTLPESPLGSAPALPIVALKDTEARKRVERACDDFRRLFPAFACYRRIVPVDEVVTLELFHRDDEPLRRLLLDDAETAALDRLWSELRYVSQDALRVAGAFDQFIGFASQENRVPEFEPLRQPIADAAAELQKRMIETEPVHLKALLEWAAKAYRRPLADAERRGLEDLYRRLRGEEHSHDEAIRLTLARVLVAPSFLYRIEQPAAGEKAQPVADGELASRLSYFLWSSQPDEELRRVAGEGRLHEPDVLVEQAHRMLRDDRVRALATEFGCQWLDIRGFDEHNEKNEQLFPEFAALRGDMYEESVRFFVNMFQHDRPVLDILAADYTLLNESLARHYGIAGVNGRGWQRVEGVKQQGRGGVLGMATVLSKQSGASRTSPVLRGNWVMEFLLGEKLPKPPKNVPQLPEQEGDANLSVRQLVERHRNDAACAKCHNRIDPFGFALEGFDAIGRLRDKDLAGRAIDTQVTLADGKRFDGVDGLRDYLLTERRDQFVRQFCRKLLGYALGRGLQLADVPLVDEMVVRLRENDYRFTAALNALVRSQQFRYQRGLEATREE